MHDFLFELNEAQREAVQATEGPVLVLAGAGSGKTKTITHRLAHLVLNKKIKPNQILAVTFTNKAADEMRNRAARLLGVNPRSWQVWSGFGQGPALGTFHAMCVRILRQEYSRTGFNKSFAIYDVEEQKRAIKKVMYNEGVSPKDTNPSAVLGLISRAKNELLDPEAFASRTNGPFEETVAALYEKYQYYLKQNQSMDFDDLLFNTVLLFKKHNDILANYQERWPYIMIDEYQDTNHAQYEFSRLLSKKRKNIFVVGDDWQGIYSWRGANIRNILEFEKDYKGAKIILLEQNYRSTSQIVSLGNEIIISNSSQKKKKLWTNRDQGDLPEIWKVENESREAEKILEKICEIECVSSQQKQLPDQYEEDEITYDYEAEGAG